MSGHWEPTAGRGDTSLLLLVGFTLSLSCSSQSFASHGLSLFLPLLQTCEHCARKNTDTHTHTLSQPTPPPSPLVLIIPLQIRRSISSRIIVSPLLTPPPPQLLYIQSRERSCPLSPCQPRWPGSSGSHNPSRPIRTPCRCKAQLDDSIPQEERRWIKKRERERESQSL